ncbi:(2Fe-2S) ferredoxin domain-containing protein [Abyssisolibacter fermentans]|uniref:(2Fe-2S) ferredoxin domain-containing protein n=1 Tax=Abyssisolibacter fermentans TaxID=1766203 RepID=UPI0008352F72|nr:NAD(P)H-dependent oxidoreductase subunit E [Abyssisolibacter fermentans]
MVKIEVCIGSACHLKGSYDVIKKLQSIIDERSLEDKIEIKASFCLGECTKAVSVRVDEEIVVSVDKDRVDEFFSEYIERRL